MDGVYVVVSQETTSVVPFSPLPRHLFRADFVKPQSATYWRSWSQTGTGTGTSRPLLKMLLRRPSGASFIFFFFSQVEKCSLVLLELSLTALQWLWWWSLPVAVSPPCNFFSSSFFQIFFSSFFADIISCLFSSFLSASSLPKRCTIPIRKRSPPCALSPQRRSSSSPTTPTTLGTTGLTRTTPSSSLTALGLRHLPSRSTSSQLSFTPS